MNVLELTEKFLKEKNVVSEKNFCFAGRYIYFKGVPIACINWVSRFILLDDDVIRARGFKEITLAAKSLCFSVYKVSFSCLYNLFSSPERIIFAEKRGRFVLLRQFPGRFLVYFRTLKKGRLAEFKGCDYPAKIKKKNFCWVTTQIKQVIPKGKIIWGVNLLSERKIYDYSYKLKS